MNGPGAGGPGSRTAEPGSTAEPGATSAAGPLGAATVHQPRVRLELEAGLREGPAHAYLMGGPPGSGKAAITRAFVAEILAAGSPDPAETRRRAMLDPSPHPDLIWLRPTGMSHAFADVKEQVIRRAPLKPFESDRRVFVIEAAEALNEESQNAMLKTLEEPPAHAHLILLSSDSEAVLPTVASRCRGVEFDPLDQAVIEAALREEAAGETGTGEAVTGETAAGETATAEATAGEPASGDPADAASIRAAARLSGGDMSRARLLAGAEGRQIRSAVEAMMAATLEADFVDSPWLEVLAIAERAGAQAGNQVSAELELEVKEGNKHTKTEIGEAVRRAERRARTGVLDLSLSLAAYWARDWTAVVSGAPELVFNTDRLSLLEEQAEGLGLGPARRAIELVNQTRRAFAVNVSEELALEALCFRLEPLLNRA